MFQQAIINTLETNKKINSQEPQQFQWNEPFA